VKVFVAGATGVIGRRLVPLLVGAGHDVTGMTRRPERAGALQAQGAEAVVCDVYDESALVAAVAASAPDVVVHELTDLPADLDPRQRGRFAGNNRIRTEGTRNLMAAAVGAGVGRVVAQSIAFAYAMTGEGLKTEDDRLYDDAPPEWAATVAALHELEDTVSRAAGVEGLVLRYGFFYGPGSAYARDGYYAREAARRRLPVVGSGSGVFSFLHVDDAAAATVAAVERGRPGIYNVVDDDPAPMRDWAPAYAEALGAKKPMRVPRLLARIAAGSYTTQLATELRGASNARAKAELGWQPRYASWRDGFREALG